MKYLTFSALALLTYVSALGQTQNPFVGDQAVFLADVTYPDNSTVNIGTKIHKQWRLQNVGSLDWRDRKLRIEGDDQGFKLVKAYPFSVKHGGKDKEAEVVVTVDLLAPQKPGHYLIRFKQWAKVDGKWQKVFPNQYKSGVYLDVNLK